MTHVLLPPRRGSHESRMLWSRGITEDPGESRARLVSVVADLASGLVERWMSWKLLVALHFGELGRVSGIAVVDWQYDRTT
jgi:hypothetical protein